MPRSMTGFGRALVEESGLSIEVELKSVNHRFLDLSFKIPRVYTQFEADFRQCVAQEVQRGRVDLFITRRVTRAAETTPQFNQALFDSVVGLYRSVLSARGLWSAEEERMVVREVLMRREVLEISEEQSLLDGERELVLKTVETAIRSLNQMREEEGRRLAQDLLMRVASIDGLVQKMKSAAQKDPTIFKDRLSKRLQKISKDVQVDEQRLALEVAILADRTDTTEEFVRLESHLAQFKTVMGEVGAGRKLDFIVQECGREINTIGSKAQDVIAQQLVIDAKTELERMREQVQNIQ